MKNHIYFFSYLQETVKYPPKKDINGIIIIYLINGFTNKIYSKLGLNLHPGGFHIPKKIICLFGNFKTEDIRNRLFLKCFKSMKNYQFIKITKPIPRFETQSFFRYFYEITKNFIYLIKNLRSFKPDLIIVLYPGIFSILIAKIFKKNKSIPILFDPFISIFNTYQSDYKRFTLKNPKGFIYYFLEFLAFKSADLILCDTFEHKKLYRSLFKPRKPIVRVFVSAIKISNNHDIKSSTFKFNNAIKIDNKKEFIVSFIGSYNPLQGVKYIVESANILRKFRKLIKFELIGGTYEQRKPYIQYCKKLNLNNVFFYEPVQYIDLLEYIDRSNIQLGIFGNTDKARRVIPTKVFVALAHSKPVITGDTQGISELLKHKKNGYLIPLGDSRKLARAILYLYSNRNILEKIAVEGYFTYIKKCSEEKICKQLRKIIAFIIS